VFGEPRDGGPWWLMRDEVSGGKFPGSSSVSPWGRGAEDLPE
jgi:hypothetical protein